MKEIKILNHLIKKGRSHETMHESAESEICANYI